MTVDFRTPSAGENIDVITGEDTAVVFVTTRSILSPVVDVRITINEEGVLTSVIGDFSDWSRQPAIAAQQSYVAADCYQTGPQNFCTFRNIQLQPSDTTVLLPITALDAQGNFLDVVLSKTFAPYTANPTITSFGLAPENCYAGGCYVHPGNNELYIQVSDAVAGMSPILVNVATGQKTTLIQ